MTSVADSGSYQQFKSSKPLVGQKGTGLTQPQGSSGNRFDLGNKGPASAPRPKSVGGGAERPLPGVSSGGNRFELPNKTRPPVSSALPRSGVAPERQGGHARKPEASRVGSGKGELPRSQARLPPAASQQPRSNGAARPNGIVKKPLVDTTGKKQKLVSQVCAFSDLADDVPEHKKKEWQLAADRLQRQKVAASRPSGAPGGGNRQPTPSSSRPSGDRSLPAAVRNGRPALQNGEQARSRGEERPSAPPTITSSHPNRWTPPSSSRPHSNPNGSCQRPGQTLPPKGVASQGGGRPASLIRKSTSPSPGRKPAAPQGRPPAGAPGRIDARPKGQNQGVGVSSRGLPPPSAGPHKAAGDRRAAPFGQQEGKASRPGDRVPGGSGGRGPVAGGHERGGVAATRPRPIQDRSGFVAGMSDEAFKAMMLKRKRQAAAGYGAKRQRYDLDQYEDDFIDDDESLDGFIDDDEPGGGDDWRRYMRRITRYDPTKYKDEHFDDRSMEAGFRDIMAEESRSLRLAREEDQREEQEEARRAAEKAAKRKGHKSQHVLEDDSSDEGD